MTVSRIHALLVSFIIFIPFISLQACAQNSESIQARLASGPYILQASSSSETCVDVSGGSTSDGAVIQSYSCNGTGAQSWSLVPVSTVSGTGYEVVSANSGACIDLTGSSDIDGGVLEQWQCLGASRPTQIWQIVAYGSAYSLVSLSSGKCIDLKNGNSGDGNQLQQWDCGNGSNPNQLWNLVPIRPATATSVTLPAGLLLVKPVSNANACMDVSGGSVADGTSVQSYSCNGTASQSWSLSGVSGGGYELVPSVSASCLTITGNSTASGAKIEQWKCAVSAQPSQQWQVFQFGSSYEFVSTSTGKCLDLTNGSSQNGNQLQQWDCGNGSNPNQLWTLTPIVAIPSQVATTTTVAQATPVSAVTGQSVVLKGQVRVPSGSPIGSLNFICDSVSVGKVSADSAGSASITIPSLANGTHTMVAQYSGSNSFAASTSQPVQVLIAPADVGETAYQSDSFVDSVGIQTHLTYDNTGYYSEWPQILAELKTSGIRHLRDSLWNWGSSAPYNAEHQALASFGIKTTYGISLDYTMTPALIQSLASQVGDLESLEAPNECDAGTNCNGGGLAGINSVVAFMPTVAAAGKALQVPVLGPSFTVPTSYPLAGDLSAVETESNLHVYFAGNNPGTSGWGGGDAQGNRYGSLAFWMDWPTQETSAPIEITETGYIAYTTVNTPYTIPESIEASYTPRTLLLDFNKGVKRTFLYELLDEVSSPGYGLLRTDASEKPAFTAVKNLLNLLSDPGANFTPGKLNYNLSGGNATLNHTLLQKRDGSFWLILWSEQSSYDPAANLATVVTPQDLTLSLSGPAYVSQVLHFDATGAVTASNSPAATQALQIVINDKLTIIHMTPQ